MRLLVKMTDDSEVAELRSQFEQIDADKSGLIDAAELKKAVADSKLKISERELCNIIENIDYNDNCHIDYTEFLTTCIDISRILTDDKL